MVRPVRNRSHHEAPAGRLADNQEPTLNTTHAHSRITCVAALALVIGLSSCADDAATAATGDTAVGGAAVSGAATYTIAAGDTLSGIADRAAVSLDALVAANGWPNGTDHVIMPGDVVMLPHGAATPPSLPATSASTQRTVVAASTTTPPTTDAQIDAKGVRSCDRTAIATAIGDPDFVTFDEIRCENGWAGGGYIDSEGFYRPVILRVEGQRWVLQEWTTVCERFADMPDSAKLSCPGG